MIRERGVRHYCLRRTLHEVRELKSILVPAQSNSPSSRTSRGVRELKCHIVTTVSKESGSPLYGVRELKSLRSDFVVARRLSHPARVRELK